MTYNPRDGERIIGSAFGAPLIIKGLSWFPANELLLWGIMSWSARKQHPLWSATKDLAAGAISMTLILGSEWLHNLAHTWTARRIGKPVDALRIFMGMPLMIYRDETNTDVSPSQHIQRALGGPVFNAFLLALAALVKPLTAPDTLARTAADAALGMNLVLSTVSFLPIPGIDGGSILKWTLIRRGKTHAQADETLVQVNRFTAAGLGVAAAYSLKKRLSLVGVICALCAALSLAIGLRLLREDDSRKLTG